MMRSPTAPNESSGGSTEIEKHQSNATSSSCEWLFPGIFIIIGLVMVLFGFRNAERAYASKYWPQAEGTIRSSAVRRSTNKNGVTYLANIAYDYVVLGTRYSNDLISFSQFGLNSSGHAESVVRRYPKDKKVRISYAANDPTLSVLEPGLCFSNSFIPLGGAAFVAAGWLLGPSRKRKLTKTSDLTVQPSV
jgi:hypothetical protein